MKELTWVEISREALIKNIRQFREIVGPDRILCPCVKANAYGHGLVGCSKTFLEAGADWLGVNALYEARVLRDSGIDAPIYILGYVPLDSLEEAVELNCRLVVYNKKIIEKLAELTEKAGKMLNVHIKVETGNNRQGVLMDDIVDFAKYIKSFEKIELEGIATHFANIEDTTDHSYAEHQLNKFMKAVSLLESAGINIPIKHCSNSAATIIFPETRFDMVRPGISCYGMWPSSETYVSYVKEVGGDFSLHPAFNWKAKIAQIKSIPSGEYIGYGCTYKTTHQTRLGIIPVGYYDGYDRGLSGRAHVLVNGKRAPLRGRVCMNIIMIDLTDIPEAEIENDVTLIGKNGDEKITVEQFAEWADTINYEIPTRVNERIPRMYL
ncbi:alanine racemase [Candidatus Peregrinibacteria bacterium]|nr:alanine racemase [Candidatus Peregrinibacteria bacterium]